jgi:type II secretion system protein G
VQRALLIILLATTLSTAEGSMSRSTRVQGDMSSLLTSLMVFENVNGRLPTAEEGLGALVANPDPARFPKWRKMLNELPRDPWGRPYQYVPHAPDGAGHGIYSLGRDGISRSNGNDPDDLSTWRDSSTWIDDEWHEHRRAVRVAAATATAACCGVAVILAVLYYRVRRRRNAEKVA